MVGGEGEGECVTTPCTFHLCPEPAGWTVSSRPYCRAHMLDAVLATGLGTVTAVRIRPTEIVERSQAVISAGEPSLTEQERFVLAEVRDAYADEDDVRCNEIAAVIDGLLERIGKAPESGGLPI